MKTLNPSDKTLYSSLQERKLLEGHKLTKEEEDELQRIKSIIDEYAEKVTEMVLRVL